MKVVITPFATSVERTNKELCIKNIDYRTNLVFQSLLKMLQAPTLSAPFQAQIFQFFLGFRTVIFVGNLENLTSNDFPGNLSVILYQNLRLGISF